MLLLTSSTALAQVAAPSEVQDVQAPATADTPPEPAAAPAADRPGTPGSAAPLDLCALRPAASGAEYVTQRVVALNALVIESRDPERELGPRGELVATHGVFAQVQAGELARQVIMRGLPLPRFSMAFSRKPAASALFDQSRLSLAAVRAAAADDFVSYSLACADWLMVPRIQRGAATWSRVEKQKTVVVNNQTTTIKYTAWSVRSPWDVKVRVYKRSGDGFVLATTLDGSAGGLTQAAAALALGEDESVAFHRYASTWPAADCTIGEPVDGQPGKVATCQGVEPELTFQLLPTPADAACGSDDSVAGGTQAMAAVARCDALESSRSAVNLLNREEKRFWAIHSSLAARGAQLVISSGEADGVHRGDYYVARGAGEQRLGFARVTQVGSGGKDAPSVLKFKSGEAPLGTQMYEHALMGVQLGLRPSTAMLVSRGDLSSRFAYGGGATIGYDLTRRLTWFDEMWGRINLGYLHATSEESLVTLDLSLEGTTYLGGGLASVLGLGVSVWFPTLERTDVTTTKTIRYSGTSTGAVARAGLEYAFGPDWCVSLGVDARTGLSKAELKSDESLLRYDAGSLLAAYGSLGVAHTF